MGNPMVLSVLKKSYPIKSYSRCKKSKFWRVFFQKKFFVRFCAILQEFRFFKLVRFSSPELRSFDIFGFVNLLLNLFSKKTTLKVGLGKDIFNFFFFEIIFCNWLIERFLILFLIKYDRIGYFKLISRIGSSGVGASFKRWVFIGKKKITECLNLHFHVPNLQRTHPSIKNDSLILFFVWWWIATTKPSHQCV